MGNFDTFTIAPLPDFPLTYLVSTEFNVRLHMDQSSRRMAGNTDLTLRSPCCDSLYTVDDSYQAWYCAHCILDGRKSLPMPDEYQPFGIVNWGNSYELPPDLEAACLLLASEVLDPLQASILVPGFVDALADWLYEVKVADQHFWRDKMFDPIFVTIPGFA